MLIVIGLSTGALFTGVLLKKTSMMKPFVIDEQAAEKARKKQWNTCNYTRTILWSKTPNSAHKTHVFAP